MFIREFTVRKHERGILFRNGDFQRFLAPAVYRFFDPRSASTSSVSISTQPAFEHRLLRLPRPLAARSRRGPVPARRDGRRRDRRDLSQRPPLDVRRAGAPRAVLEGRRAREGRAHRRHDATSPCRGASRSLHHGAADAPRVGVRRGDLRARGARGPRRPAVRRRPARARASRPACTRSGRSAAIYASSSSTCA